MAFFAPAESLPSPATLAHSKANYGEFERVFGELDDPRALLHLDKQVQKNISHKYPNYQRGKALTKDNVFDKKTGRSQNSASSESLELYLPMKRRCNKLC